MSTPVLQVRDVHVRHRIPGARLMTKDTVYALTGADITVDAGQTLGIVGESGCGKSTLAQAVVGLRRPTAGEVIFHGASLWEMSAAQRRTEFGRRVGMIFQDPSTALNRRMPVRRILRDPLDVHAVGTPAQREARVTELMDVVGLPAGAADALPSQLSGGQRQRVAIGRALALGPSLLVADEPTSALDVSVRAQILNLLLRLKDELNLAMIYISHDIQTVRRMSDRIATMYLGRIVEEAPVAATPEHARHPYTAALFSATPSLVHEIDPIALHGPVPSAVHPPSGCPFHPRCFAAAPDCAVDAPPLQAATGDPTGGDHTFRCHHPLTPGTPLPARATAETGPEPTPPVLPGAPEPDPDTAEDSLFGEPTNRPTL